MLDNSDLLDDEDYVQPVTIVSFGYDEEGARIETGRREGVLASVQPGPKLVSLQGEGKRLEDSITVFIKSIYATDGITTASDCVLWNGFLYEVASMSDFRNFGYIKAVCRRRDETVDYTS